MTQPTARKRKRYFLFFGSVIAAALLCVMFGPPQVLARSEAPIFVPERPWERTGQVPNVVFVEGMVRDGARWLFYYGGADRTVGVATAPVR